MVIPFVRHVRCNEEYRVELISYVLLKFDVFNHSSEILISCSSIVEHSVDNRETAEHNRAGGFFITIDRFAPELECWSWL